MRPPLGSGAVRFGAQPGPPGAAVGGPGSGCSGADGLAGVARAGGHSSGNRAGVAGAGRGAPGGPGAFPRAGIRSWNRRESARARIGTDGTLSRTLADRSRWFAGAAPKKPARGRLEPRMDTDLVRRLKCGESKLLEPASRTPTPDRIHRRVAPCVRALRIIPPTCLARVRHGHCESSDGLHRLAGISED